jgi:Tfp pilus assembly protein PilF
MTAAGPARRPTSGLRRAATWVALALTLCVTAWVFWESQRLIRADFASVAARQQVALWVAGSKKPASAMQWESAREAIERALEIAPDDPAMHAVRGDVYMVAGEQRWFNAQQRQAHYREAIASYRQSLQLRPTEPQTWASLAAAHYGAREFGAPMQEAWARALALGPHEGYVQPMLMDLALATWPDASPAMRQWVEDTFENAPQSTRIEINKMAALRGLQLSVAASAPSTGASPNRR